MMTFKRSLIATTVALVGFYSTTVFAQSTIQQSEGTNIKQEEEEGSGEDDYERPWGLAANVISRVGQGTFADLENETSTPGTEAPNDTAFDRWLMIYAISPSYEIGEFSFAGELAWTHWLTQGGGLNEPGEFRFEDAYLYADWGTKIKAIDSRFSSQLSLGFPTSDVSQTATQNLATSLTARLSKTWDWFTLSYETSGTWRAHESKVPQVSEDVNPVFRAGGAEDVGNDLVAINGVNTQYAWANTLLANVDLWGDFSASASYSYTRYWSYHRDNNDEFASEFQDIGRGTSDLMRTTAMLSYDFNDYLSLSGGIRTLQPPKTDDNDQFRFPFWNTRGAARNFSSVQFALTGSY